MDRQITGETPIFPQKARFISGSALKTIAAVSMLTDHVGAFLLYNLKPIPLFTVGGYTVTLYRLFRWCGRLAFPIFVFLLVEGFLHTRDMFRYGLNLLSFAVISEVPWNLAHVGSPLYPKAQNVFFTLFIGYLGLCAIEYFRSERKKLVFLLLLLLGASFLFSADYGALGYGFIIMMYVLRGNELIRAVVGCGFLAANPAASAAFIPIGLYNGKRGFIKGKILKYAFYAIYPVHLTALYLIRLNYIPY